MTTLLYCHDHPELAEVRAELYKNEGHRVFFSTSARDSLTLARTTAKDVEVAIIHKDLGLGLEPVDAEQVVREIREKNELVRIGIVSGEFPHGRSHVVERLQADFYFPTRLSTLDPWILDQINSGLILPPELEQRGKTVVTPEGPSLRERHRG